MLSTVLRREAPRTVSDYWARLEINSAVRIASATRRPYTVLFVAGFRSTSHNALECNVVRTSNGIYQFLIHSLGRRKEPSVYGQAST